MKTYNNLWSQFISFENLYLGYRRAAKCKYYRQEVLKFSKDLEENLIELQNELIWSMYQPSEPRLFYVYEPKKRLISAPAFKDRIVHHALCAVIEPLIDKKFIYDTYACRKEKGTLAAVQRVQHFTRLAKRNYGSYYVFKGDIHSFFPSINHDILKSQIRRTICDKKIIWLMDTIIDSTGEIGLPIGALTSQLFANLMLNPLDHLIKEEMGIKYYVRYMDDITLILKSKKEAQKVNREITNYVEQKLGLTMNTKSQIIRASQGIPFCGFRIWPTHILPNKPTLRRGKRRLKKLAYLHNKGFISLDAFRASLMSFLGHYKYCNSRRSIESALDRIVLTGERK
jgi:retron-type reverse transcriptase